jgi:hypothetical protein
MTTKLQELLEELKGLQKILLSTSGVANKIEQLITKYTETPPTEEVTTFTREEVKEMFILAGRYFDGEMMSPLEWFNQEITI